MDKPTTKISGNLRGAALGATLAMLPMAFVMLLTLLKVYIGEDVAKALVILQFAGCLLWAGCLTGAVSGAKQYNVSGGGLGLCILGILIGGILQIIVVFDESLLNKVFRLADGEMGSFLLILLVTIIINLPLAIGTLKAGSTLHSLRRASVGYFILAIYPVVLYLLVLIFVKRSYNYYYGYSSHGLETAMTIFVILLVILALICVSGWWGAASNASDLEDEANDEDDSIYVSQSTYIEQPAQPAATQSSYAQPQPAQQPLRPKTPITDEQRKLLMGMTNQELTNVVNNPALYANQAFVDEARKTLTKRQAWEMIKDYSDDQLLNVVHNNVQGFSAEVLDAASMELLSRENATFINEVASLSTQELQGILANADSYYDGYVQLATRIINDRLNNPGNNPA